MYVGAIAINLVFLHFFRLANSLQPSGSTGTFAFAIPSTDGKTVELRVVHSDELSC